MIYHAHMYYIISDSGLASDKKIQRSKGNFFNPIHVLRDKFKGKYFYHLKDDKDGDKKIYFVRFYEDSLRLDEGEYNDWKEKLFESDLFELNWHTLS